MKAEAASRREEHHKFLSERDVLTGLYNRRGWEQLLHREEARCQQFGFPASVMVIDLDNLKVYQQNLNEKGYTVEIKLGFGKSASTISNIINQTDADILVMGAHGHMGLKDFIFGSTVDKVRHQVKIPVLIIK